MKASRKTLARPAARQAPLSLTQRIERLERHYFAQQPSPKASGSRFVVEGDSVHDRTTGLQWTRGNVGEKALNWADAKAAAAAVRIGDRTDWRLPTIRELLTLADYERKDPAIDPAFKCDSAWYWTSTPAAASPSGCAWIVYFGSGHSSWGYQSFEGQVRAVRPGQIVGTLA